MGNQLSAQDNRRVGRALVCGALLVYGCLRIPAAAQPAAAPQAQELQKLEQNVCQLEARPQQVRDELGAPRQAAAAMCVMSSPAPGRTSPQ